MCEFGQVTDMLKDLAEAMYYRTLTNTMEEFDPESMLDVMDRYGERRFYDNYRYSNGRFVRKVEEPGGDTKITRHTGI